MNDLIDDLINSGDAVVLSFEEAEKNLYKNKPIPKFNLIIGQNKSLPHEVMIKENKTAQAVWTISKYLKTKYSKQKLNLPLFSFNINGKLSALVLDIEDGTSMIQMREALKDFTYMAYYSASSELEKQRLRFIIPFSEDVKADEFDYCKDKLFEIFDKIPDIHSFESKRFFFCPSNLIGCFRDENKIFENYGASIDFYKTTGFNQLDKFKMHIKNKTFETNEKCVVDDERVQYYLNTDFPLMSGNGDSASSLYTAIVTCLANEDEDTLEMVLDKARDENWSEKELERKVKDAKKFLNL